MALASDSDDMDGEFADAGRMSHIATGPLRPLVSMPIINGNPVKACAQVSRPYVHGLTVAATDVSGRTMLFDMHEFSSMHGCRYSVYLPVATMATCVRCARNWPISMRVRPLASRPLSTPSHAVSSNRKSIIGIRAITT